MDCRTKWLYPYKIRCFHFFLFRKDGESYFVIVNCTLHFDWINYDYDGYYSVILFWWFLRQQNNGSLANHQPSTKIRMKNKNEFKIKIRKKSLCKYEWRRALISTLIFLVSSLSLLLHPLKELICAYTHTHTFIHNFKNKNRACTCTRPKNHVHQRVRVCIHWRQSEKEKWKEKKKKNFAYAIAKCNSLGVHTVHTVSLCPVSTCDYTHTHTLFCKTIRIQQQQKCATTNEWMNFKWVCDYRNN